MTEKPYSKREQDMRYDSLHEKLDEIIKKVNYTNSKVKKIIIVLVAVAAYSLGTGSGFFVEMLKLIL